MFVIIGGLIVLALTAALVAPYFIDWTPYRSDFEREASRILGRQVKVEGSARARLLPFPSVTFTDVTVAGNEPGQPAMTVHEFSMDAELAPFLRGEILIFDMTLVHPSATVAIDKDGRIDWAMQLTSRVDPSQVTLEHVTVSDGRIAVDNRASGRTHTVSDINAVLSARSLAGPWRIDGRLKFDGVATPVSISTGKVDPGQGMRIRVSAKPDNYPFDLDADGRAMVDEKGAAAYAGTFNLRSRAEDADTADQPSTSVDEEAGNRVDGAFRLTNDRLSIDNFRLATGPVKDPYTAEGRAFIELSEKPRFSVVADGAQINFDAGKGAGESGGIASLPLKKRFASLRTFLLNLPKPSMPGTIRMRLPAIVAGDTTIRDISLLAEPAKAGWSIGSLSATLPGRTRFEAKGLLKTGGALAFSGHMLLAVKQPSGFAAWLASDVDEAIRRLPAAGFSADVDLAEKEQSFKNLELILGDARFSGSIERRNPDGARPSLTLKLKGGKLDLEGVAAFSSLFVSDDGVIRLADHDIDFTVQAGPVTARGLTAQGVDTAFRLQGGSLEIDRMHIEDLAGANIGATGTMDDFASRPSGKIDATVVANDLQPLISQLAQRFPEIPLISAMDRRAHFYPGLLENADINVLASAADNGDGSSGIAISANGKAGGTSFSFGASANGAPDDMEAAPFTADFTAKNDEAAALYALYGIPSIPIGLAGAAETELSLKGTIKDGAETSFLFSGDGLKANFDGKATFDKAILELSGKANLESSDLDPWLAAAGLALPGFGFGLPAKIDSSLGFDGAHLTLSNMTGSVAGSAVSGDLAGEVKDGRPDLSGTLHIADLDLALPAAMIVGDSVLGGGGDPVWPSTPFQQGISAPFTADLKLGVDALTAGRADIGRDASMQFALDKQGIRISDISAMLDGGKLSGLADFKNNAGSGLFSGQLKLQQADLAKLSPTKGLKGKVDLTAALTASGKSVEGMIAALSGSGTATFGDLTIRGVNPDAIDALIGKADDIGHDIDAADTASFAPGIVDTGTFMAGSTELAYSVAGGVVRAPPLQLADGKTRMSVDTHIDLTKLTGDIRASVAYDPGRESVLGSEPVVRFSLKGPLGAMKPTVETQPLAQYLTQRALEREEARVEHMQAVLLEKQRLRREDRYYAALEAKRKRADEERRRFKQESERMRQETDKTEREAAEARRKSEEAAKAEAAKTGEADGSPADAASQTPAGEGDGSAIKRAPLSPPEQNDNADEAPRESKGLRFPSSDFSGDGLARSFGASQ